MFVITETRRYILDAANAEDAERIFDAMEIDDIWKLPEYCEETHTLEELPDIVNDN